MEQKNGSIINLEAAEKAMRDFLQAMGQDIDREGLKDTPKRYVKFFNEFLTPDKFNFTTFDSEKYN